MKTPLLLFFLVALALGSCQSSKVTSSNQTTDSLTRIGGDKDKHGCLTSAGYTWSQLRSDCIRPFEEGIALHTLNTSGAYQTAAYVVVDSIKKQAEIFVPEEHNSILLTQKEAKNYSNGKFHLTQDSNCWTLRLNATPLYQEQK